MRKLKEEMGGSIYAKGYLISEVHIHPYVVCIKGWKSIIRIRYEYMALIRFEGLTDADAYDVGGV